MQYNDIKHSCITLLLHLIMDSCTEESSFFVNTPTIFEDIILNNEERDDIKSNSVAYQDIVLKKEETNNENRNSCYDKNEKKEDNETENELLYEKYGEKINSILHQMDIQKKLKLLNYIYNQIKNGQKLVKCNSCNNFKKSRQKCCKKIISICTTCGKNFLNVKNHKCKK
jgi:hypothetical protein